MMPATMTSEYVTRGELDIKLKSIEDTEAHRNERTEERHASLEKMIDVKLSRMEALIDRSISENRAMVSDIRAELNDVKGDVKAIDARLSAFETKFGWYLMLFGAGITIALALLQLLMKS